MRKLNSVSASVILVLIWLLVTLLSAPLANAESNLSANDNELVIVGANIIDGTGSPPLLNYTIVIEDGEIEEIGPSGSIDFDEDATVIDATGKWVVPGFIDTHIHLWQSSRLYASPASFDLRDIHPTALERAFVEDRFDYALTRYLCSGVTGIVDLGGPFLMFDVQELAEDQEIAPRMKVGGRLIGDSALPDFEFLWTPEDPASVAAITPEEGRALVQAQIEAGADLIKTGYLGALPIDDYITVLEAIIDEAHDADKKVAVHALDIETAKRALLAGADMMAHAPAFGIVDDAFLQLAVEKDPLWAGTVNIFETIPNVVNEQVNLLPIETACGDPDAIETFDDLAPIPLEDRPTLAPLPFPPEVLVANMQENTRLLHEAGVRVVIGTDGGNIGILHGASLHREMKLMVEGGIDPMGVLVAATRNGASFIGMEDEVGTIEEDKLADLLILGANPLDDISNTQTIEYVIKGGTVFTHEELVTLNPGDDFSFDNDNDDNDDDDNNDDDR